MLILSSIFDFSAVMKGLSNAMKEVTSSSEEVIVGRMSRILSSKDLICFKLDNCCSAVAQP